MDYQVTTIHDDHDAVMMLSPPLACPCKSTLRESSRQEPPETTRVSGTCFGPDPKIAWEPPWFTMHYESEVSKCIKIIPMKSGRAPQTGSTGHSPCSTLLQHSQISGPRTIRNSASSTSTINASPASSQEWDYWLSNSQSGPLHPTTGLETWINHHSTLLNFMAFLQLLRSSRAESESQ